MEASKNTTQMIFWGLGLCIALSMACRSTSSVSGIMPEQIVLSKLVAINLSEDQLHLSTHNDEILLLTYLVGIKVDTVSIRKAFEVGPFLFDTLQMQHRLDLSIRLDSADSSYLILALVELDNEQEQVDTIKDQIRSEVKAGAFLKPGQEPRLDRLLRYDDFLGWEVLPLSNFKSKKVPQPIRFTGLQLFDRFEYLLSWQSH